MLAYKSSYTSQGYACQGEYRYCSNGKLNGSYQYRSCTMSQDRYVCQLPWGGKIPHGSSVLAYANSSSPCASQMRTCSYGRLSGNYRYSSCQSTNNHYQYSCQLPWGGSIPHGASVTAFNSPYGNCYSERRTCYNGTLAGSYGYSSCQNTNNNGCYGNNCGNHNNNRCQLPWGGSIAHGSSVTAYSSPNGPCYSQTRTCYN